MNNPGDVQCRGPRKRADRGHTGRRQKTRRCDNGAAWGLDSVASVTRREGGAGAPVCGCDATPTTAAVSLGCFQCGRWGDTELECHEQIPIAPDKYNEWISVSLRSTPGKRLAQL